MSELSLNKIQTPTEAKLFRNFAYGSRAKIFLPLNPSNFCPLAKIFCAAFSILKFYSYNGSSIYDVATEGSNVPKGKGVSPEAYMLCYAPLRE